MTETQTFNTDCSMCIWNNSNEPNVECSLGRFEKFQTRNEVNGENKIIRLCSACRDESWRIKHEEHPKEDIKKELQNVYSIIIADTTPFVLDNLKKTLAVHQTVDPRQIIVVYYGTASLSDVLSLINAHIGEKKIKGNVVRSAEQKDVRGLVDLAVKSADGLGYIVIENGDVLPENTIERIYNEIDERLEKIIYISPFSNKNSGEDKDDWMYSDNATGMFVHRVFHQMVNGNFSIPIESKLNEALEVDNMRGSIKTWQQIGG